MPLRITSIYCQLSLYSLIIFIAVIARVQGTMAQIIYFIHLFCYERWLLEEIIKNHYCVKWARYIKTREARSPYFLSYFVAVLPFSKLSSCVISEKNFYHDNMTNICKMYSIAMQFSTLIESRGGIVFPFNCALVIGF